MYFYSVRKRLGLPGRQSAIARRGVYDGMVSGKLRRLGPMEAIERRSGFLRRRAREYAVLRF